MMWRILYKVGRASFVWPATGSGRVINPPAFRVNILVEPGPDPGSKESPRLILIGQTYLLDITHYKNYN